MKECPYTYPEPYPKYASTITCAIYAIYCLVIVAINVILIVSFFATKQSMKNTSNLLIVCLSISDCLIGVIVIPMVIIENLWFDSVKLCSILRVSIPMRLLFCGISFIMTMLLAIDRYIHMNPNVLENESMMAKSFKIQKIYFLIFTCCALFIARGLTFYFLLKIIPRLTAYLSVLCAIILLVMMLIFVTIYTRCYL